MQLSWGTLHLCDRLVCNETHIYVSSPRCPLFFFFFFQPAIVDFVNCEQCICLLFTVPQIILFSNFFIKNGSHNTIYTFKNYFATVFLVSVFSFSKNKLNPNTPYVDIAKYLKDMEPAIESDKRKVHKPKCFTPKVRLVTKLPFQYLEGFKKFLLAYLQLFSFCCPYLHWNIINLYFPRTLSYHFPQIE